MNEQTAKNRLQIIDNYLKNNSDLDILKSIILEDNDENLLKNLLNNYNSYISKIKNDLSLVDLTYLNNMKSIILTIIKSDNINNFDSCLGKIRKVQKSILVIESILKKSKDISNLETIKKILNDAQIIEEEIMKKLKSEYNDNTFEFLTYIINDIQNKKYLEYILSLYPYYINTKDINNTHIIFNILETYLHEIIINDKNNISKVLYYESVIERFLSDSRFKLSIDNVNLLKEKVKVSISQINNNKDTIKKYSQKIACLNSLLEKLESNNFSKEDMETLNRKYNVNLGFNIDAQKELETITNNNDIIITIDDEDTLDMDDAIFIRKNDQTYTLIIYISDVANSVKLNGAIDNEAYNRFSTLYLSDTIIPMLPFELSNNILSLNTNSLKKVIAYEVEIDNNGVIINSSISSRQIQITHKLSYKTVNKILEHGTPDTKLYETLKNLSDLSMILRKNNLKKSSYRKIEDLSKKVFGQELEKEEYKNRTKAEIIIEECMILGNILPAKLCFEKDLPYIYRVHPKIEETKEYEALSKLQAIVNNEYKISSEAYLSVIDSLIKMYPAAYYSMKNIGHFGLNLDVYSHSTSPLRRYADLVNQRITHDLILQTPSLEKVKYWETILNEICIHMNETAKTKEEYQKDYEKVKRLTKGGM